jgi:hypothetical protein
MAEQAAATTTQTPAEGTTGTATTSVPLDISKYIEPDGKFKEGWKNSPLVPEELRTNKVYDLSSNLQEVLKMLGHQSVTLGKYGTTKGVLPITEKSSPFEIEAFRTALGVPKDATGYKYVPPEDISVEDMSPEFLQPTLAEFNKAHYTQPQVDVAMNLYANHLRLIDKAVDDELARQVADAQGRLETEWGDKLEARTNLAKAFITKMASGWSPEKYKELFGQEVTITNQDGTQTKTREGGINDAEFAPLRPLLLDLFANIEEKYGVEDSALAPEVAGARVVSVQQQIEEIEATPGFMDGKLRSSLDSRDRAKYDELIKQRDALYKKQYPG